MYVRLQIDKTPVENPTKPTGCGYVSGWVIYLWLDVSHRRGRSIMLDHVHYPPFIGVTKPLPLEVFQLQLYGQIYLSPKTTMFLIFFHGA